MKSRLYVFEGKQEKPTIKYIVQDYTIKLMCIYIVVFVLYGVFSTAVIDAITIYLETNKAELWLSIVANKINVATTECCAIMMEIIKGLLYLLLVGIIWIVGQRTMAVAQKKNDDRPVYTGQQIRTIMNRAMLVTSVFFFAYAIVGNSSLDSYIATAFVNFVGSCFISIGNFREGKEHKEISVSHPKTRIDRQINFVFVCCLVAILPSILLDYLANRYILEYSIAWVVILIVMITFCFLDSYDRYEVNKAILERSMGESVLIYGQLAYGTLLQNKIFRSINKQCISYRNVSNWLENREYNTIIIVAPFGSKMKSEFITEKAKNCLTSDGVIIAPSYTSSRKGSALLSPEAYKAKLEDLGFEIKREFISKFRKITYVEMSKK